MISNFKTTRNFGGVQLLVFLLIIQTSRFAQLFYEGYEFSLVTTKFSFLSFTVNTIIIFFCGILLNNILNRYDFFESNSQLGAATFFIFCAFIPFNQNIDIWLIPLVLSLIIFNKLIKVRKASRIGRNYFDSVFLLGIIAVFFPVYLLYLLPIWLSMVMFRKPIFSSFALTIVSLLMVTMFWSVYLFWINDFGWFQRTFFAIKDSFIVYNMNVINILQSLYFFAILWVITFFFWLSRRRKLNVTSFGILQYSSVLAIIGIGIAVCFFTQQIEILIFTFFAFSVLISYLLYYTKTKLANVLFLLLTGYAILYPWIKHINIDI